MPEASIQVSHVMKSFFHFFSFDHFTKTQHEVPFHIKACRTTCYLWYHMNQFRHKRVKNKNNSYQIGLWKSIAYGESFIKSFYAASDLSPQLYSRQSIKIAATFKVIIIDFVNNFCVFIDRQNRADYSSSQTQILKRMIRSSRHLRGEEPSPSRTCWRNASISGSSCCFPDARLSMNSSSKVAPFLRNAFKQLSARSSPRRFTASRAFSLSKSIWPIQEIRMFALKMKMWRIAPWQTCKETKYCYRQ